MAVVNELVTKFTFKGTLAPLKEFQEGTKNAVIGIGKMGAAMGAAALATAAWANSTLRGAESLVRLSQDTDISVEKLQKLQFIAAQNGVTADSFTQSVVTLNQKIGEAATSGSDDFNRLGISVRDANGNIRSSEDILKDLNQSFRGLSQAQKIDFAGKLGIDQRLITAFDKSDEELKKLTDRAGKFGLVTAGQTKQMDKYFASIESLKFGFTAISRQMALNFAPIMENLSNNVVDFLADFGVTFTKVFAEFIDGIGNLLSFFGKLIDSTIGWKATLIAFGAAVAIAFPFTAIVAGVGLVLVAIEDLITAFSGGQSVIANFFKETFGIDIVKELTAAFEVLSSWIDIIADKFDMLLNSFREISGKVKEMFGGITETVGGIFGGISSFFGGGDTQTQQMQPIPASNTSTNNQTMQNSIKIEVKSNDPEAAGQAVNTALNRELENANFQFGKGGR